MNRKRKKRMLLFAFLLLTIPFFYSQNNWLTLTNIEVKSPQLPAEFDGFRIIQLSDLHSKRFGQEQQKIAKKVKEQRPDVIFYTGDLIDRRKNDEEAGYRLMEEMVAIAPVYFVTGNHEWQVFKEKETKLREIGVKVLRNEQVSLEQDGVEIGLIGIDDPLMTETGEAFEQAGSVTAPYTILLSHRPEYFVQYANAGMDLVFTGHAHGGQIRIPFVGGLFAPGQGFFPESTSGAHAMDSTTMIVNRGLGNSMAPQRIFNRPEIMVVELKSSK